MNHLSRNIIRTYIFLVFGNTLAASFIWGINTIFLLDAGLSNFEAFAANAFFTLGMVLFEVPTGVVADTWGRRVSYLLGTITLAVTTGLYFLLWQMHAPFWEWAVVSMLLGLGFTFFSGAVEAWLVDALEFAKHKGSLESVFGRGQMAGGIAMLLGSLGGGVIAQVTNVGVPFIVRAVVLVILFAGAFFFMRDLGFSPDRSASPGKAMSEIWRQSLQHGLKNPPVRWMMIASIFAASVGFYVFYALQPYLLQLYGDASAYWVAGLAAAIVALAQIIGGSLAGKIRGLFAKRTSAMIAATIVTCVALVGMYVTTNFYVALTLVAVWGLMFAAVMPIRQAYMNALIPSKQRATVLSFDSLMGNTGGIVIQPALGRVTDLSSYATSFLVGGVIQLVSLPFIFASRRQKHPADRAETQSS